MSAFVVDPKTMHNAVQGVVKALPDRLVRETFGVSGQDETALGRVLYSLNVEAIRQRYPDTQDDPANMPGPIEPIPACRLPDEYRHDLRFVGGRIHQYKAVQCLIYQCAEGDVPKTPQFETLKDVERLLADSIVSDLPEYRAAHWG